MQKRARSIESSCKKQWRYRMNKKRKFFERRQSNSAASPSVDKSMNFGHEGGSSDSSSITSEHWRIFMDEADNFRQVRAEKKAKLDEKYETFVDHSPSFPKDHRQIVIPECLSGIELK